MTLFRKILLLTIFLIHLVAGLACAADVVVVGDAKLRPVSEILAGMEKTLKVPVKTYAPARVKGSLAAVVADEGARVVVALGREALGEALRLPPPVLVIYGLVLVPPAITRPNTTGFSMATPAREYLDLIASRLPGLGKVAVIGRREQICVLARTDSPHASVHSVKSSFELVSTIQQLSGVDAILLLPDVYLLTSSAMEEAYLYSFRKKIPLLGISEKSVKDGALLALVVDSVQVGKQIGDYATRALKGAGVTQLPPAPPRKFDLFLNLDTARKMKIHIPEDVARNARRTYP